MNKTINSTSDLMPPYDSISQYDTLYPVAQYYKGYYLFKKSSLLDQAIISFNQVPVNHHFYDYAQFYKGLCLMKLQKIDLALEALNSISTYQPFYPQVFYFINKCTHIMDALLTLDNQVLHHDMQEKNSDLLGSVGDN